ncbi:substrate-binding and VWA domain-containing protein [Nonomuraea sp. NPDC050310]|uniref:substrate-binding and VWA domain-containing protein n=1 Tax=unclassified Nonomuraea TaxID=2593643 RepID=UPI0033EAC8D7
MRSVDRRAAGGTGFVRQGQHRSLLMTRRRRALWRGLAAALGALALIAVGVVAIRAGGGGGCAAREPVLVSVAAAGDIAPAAMEAAGRFNETKAAVDGWCVLVQVSEQAPATVLRTLLGERAGVLSERPDAWISDSSAWVRLARENGRLTGPETVVATSPLVFATRSSLAQRFAVSRTEMNWQLVFPAAARGRLRPTDNEPDIVRVPDPSLAGAGIATVAAARDVVGSGPDADKALTAFVRWAQAGSAPDYRTLLAAAEDRSFWQRPVVIVPEQSVLAHTALGADPIVALHPREGTINLDYPYQVTATDPRLAEGAALFGRWLRGAGGQEVIRRAGFRAADGSGAGGAPGAPTPRLRPTVSPGDIDEALQAWSRLAPPTNILVLAETSKHMAEPLAGRTRLEVAMDAARLGLQLFPDSTRMGLWEFAETHRKRVSLGPVAEPEAGELVRRGRLTTLTGELRAHPKQGSALHQAIDAGFREMTSRYAETMNNTLLVITSGRDDGGLSRAALLERLRREWDPERPVQIVIIAFGSGADRVGLGEIAAATNGSLHVAKEPGEIIDVFLAALARRLCHPVCGATQPR